MKLLCVQESIILGEAASNTASHLVILWPIGNLTVALAGSTLGSLGQDLLTPPQIMPTGMAQGYSTFIAISIYQPNQSSYWRGELAHTRFVHCAKTRLDTNQTPSHYVSWMYDVRYVQSRTTYNTINLFLTLVLMV